MNRLALLNDQIVGCHLCPRLVKWREEVAEVPPKRYFGEDYWAKPVPLFGDLENAKHLIVGLAPAAHGANRTGRMFHGDRSGDWLFRALHKAGVARLPKVERIEDGQELYGVVIAATAHCAPPDNKPLPSEIQNCSRYLRAVLEDRVWISILCLGSIAWNHVHRIIGVRAPQFGHLATHNLESKTLLVASYHPSQQNTFTKKLTEPMLDEAIRVWLTQIAT